MYALSLGFFRNLVRRRGVRLLSTQNPPQEVVDDLEYFELEGIGDVHLPDSTRYQVSQTVTFIKEKKPKGARDWGQIDKKLIEAGISNPATKIFQACLRLDDLPVGLSYYNYLLETGQSLSIMDLLFFSKLLLKNKHEIRKYEPLLLKLYNDIREHFLSSALIRKFTLNVFLEIPSCFDDIVSILKSQKEKVGYSYLVGKALELNKPEIAFEFMNDDCFSLSSLFLEQFVQFCINRAKEGISPIDFINRLANLCERQVLTFNSCNLKQNLDTLVNGLNECQDEYHWYVEECSINEMTQQCSGCNQILLPKPLTKEEVQLLRDHFFDAVFVKKDIYLTSDEKEVKNFFQFLETAQPFDIVVDVLNVIYRKKNVGVQVANRTLNYFLNKNMSVLLVSRKHSKGVVLKAVDTIEPKLRHKVQTFFTTNVSEDDIFILQAALHGGLGVGFLTGDNCNNHFVHMDSIIKKSFLKWQMTHQYKLNSKLMIEPPLSNCGVPQLTYCAENETYIWHFSHQPERSGRLSPIFPVEWVCLKANKKERKSGKKGKMKKKRSKNL